MHQPVYQLRLERMVDDQRNILVQAAYGDGRIWSSLAEIYRFDEPERFALRSYILENFMPDGRRMARVPKDEPRAAWRDRTVAKPASSSA